MLTRRYHNCLVQGTDQGLPTKRLLDNFIRQMDGAQKLMLANWTRLKAMGYVEVVPGVLQHPETGVEILNG